MAQDEVTLLGCRKGTDRNRNGTDLRCGEESGYPFGAIRDQDRNTVASRDTKAGERLSQTPSTLLQIDIARIDAIEAEGDARAEAADDILEKTGQREPLRSVGSERESQVST